MKQVFGSNEMPNVHPDVTTALFDDDELAAVVYDTRADATHRLSAEAVSVWLFCDGRTSVAAMADELIDIFGLAPESVAADVQRALAQFWSLGLLRGSSGAEGDHSSKEATLVDRVLARPPDP